MLTCCAAKHRERLDEQERGRIERSFVDGLAADQMETEKASHATEESPSIAPFGVSHPQTDKLINPTQNGSPSPEVGPPYQLNGDSASAWDCHFKHSNGGDPGADPMKRHRETCSSPAAMQDLFDQTGLYGMKGELRHAVEEQTELGPTPPKRPRVTDLQINSEKEMKAWESRECDGAGEGLDGVPQLAKDPSDYECSAMQDGKLDDKAQFDLPNGDIFSLPRSKPVPISNGAMETSTMMPDPSGDLLEKSLSQYYPEQVSIAMQIGQSQADREADSAVSSDGPKQNTQSPSLTSGYPVSSSQMPICEQQADISADMPTGNGGFGSQFTVNGFGSSFGGEHYQHPQQQQQQQRPLSDLCELQQPHTLDQVPGMVAPQQATAGSQTPNGGREHFHMQPEGPSIFSKPNAEFNQSPYLPSVDSSTRLHPNKDNAFGPFGGSVSTSRTPDGQHGMQYSVQQKPGLPGPKPAPPGPLSELSKLQHMPQHCSLPPQQAETFFAQQEHLGKSLEQASSPNFVLPPNPQQDGHQMASTLQHRSSEGGPFRITPKALHALQGTLDPELVNCLKMDIYNRSEKHQQQEMKSPTYRAPLGTSPLPISSPSHRPNPQFSQNDQTVLGFNGAEGPSMQDNFSNVMEAQNQQRPHSAHGQQSASPSPQRQYPPQQHHHSHHSRMTNHMDISQPRSNEMPPPPAEHQHQTQGQMYPKSDLPGPCAQYQYSTLPSPGPQGDFQRHAALRMLLLQKQERQGAPQGSNDIRHSMAADKQENGPRFEGPHVMPQQQGPQLLPNGSRAPVVKQEPSSSTCAQDQQQRSILATMEQQLRQYQLSPMFERKSLVVKSPNKVKVEMSGGVAVVTTNLDTGGGEDTKQPDVELKREPGLQHFVESPMKFLDKPIKSLLDTPLKTQYDIPPCHCVEQISEKDEGPFYTHLGAGPNIKAVREIMEKRSGFSGSAIRIEKVIFTGKEGKSTQGCPIAKWVIRRGSTTEKLLVLVREREKHHCDAACIVVVMLIWEGIPLSLANEMYAELSDTLTKHGAHTNRRCALNEERTCACQGLDPDACGASFSFGCSWSMYYNGCKFARSKTPRKFKLLGDHPKEEERLEHSLQRLATITAPVYKQMAPEAYNNQVEHEHRAPDCRLGLKEGRPFSGVTACLDFCAHAHRDLHNMQGGSTVVCTLTREDNRGIGKIPEDEQLHVLPLYKAAPTDEFGSEEAQQEKMRTGAIQVLKTFRRQVRMLAEPAKSCRQKKLDAKRASANKLAGHPDTPNSKADKAALVKKQSTYENARHGVTGPLGSPLRPGQQPLPLGPPLQHPQGPFPGSPQHGGYPQFPGSPAPFPSSSKTGGLYPPSPVSAGPYLPSLHGHNAYMNGGGHPGGPYPGTLAPNNLYPGFQGNGGMAMEGYHPFYPNGPKHIDMYRQQRPPMYPEQQYGGHQHYPGVPYIPPPPPPHYSQVNGFSNCAMRPGVPQMGPYPPPYTPNGGPDAQLLDAISHPPSAHPGLDYVNKGRYPNSYLPQNPELFSPVPGGTQPPYGPYNGGMQSPMLKQEPPVQSPITPRQKEELWSDNEHNFLDPEIGGVAVAPSHGSILIECAKRELHATTPVKQPNRMHPTRISLVFYQHKNLNEAKHGLALWEAKLAEKAREKEEEALRNGVASPQTKGPKKTPPVPPAMPKPAYNNFIQTLVERSFTSPTHTSTVTAPYAFTKVTGPYNCAV